ncbi:MAG: alpha/beta hydrolase [Pseudomonadota bacterium]
MNATITSFDGTALRGDCYGGPEPALVFVHGAFQSRQVWKHQIDAFRGANRVIAYDLRGHGRSARPQSDTAYRADWTPARDVAAVLDHFGAQRAILIGWSFGSIVAADAAVHLGRERIAGLILVSGTIESATPRNGSNFGPVSRESISGLGSADPAVRRAATRRYLQDSYRYGQWDPVMFDTALEANLEFTATERALVVARPEHRYAEALRSTGMPVMLIHGDADGVFLADSSVAAATELPDATLKLYPDTGHWPFLERPARFNADVREFAQTIAR